MSFPFSSSLSLDRRGSHLTVAPESLYTVFQFIMKDNCPGRVVVKVGTGCVGAISKEKMIIDC